MIEKIIPQEQVEKSEHRESSTQKTTQKLKELSSHNLKY